MKRTRLGGLGFLLVTVGACRRRVVGGRHGRIAIGIFSQDDAVTDRHNYFESSFLQYV